MISSVFNSLVFKNRSLILISLFILNFVLKILFLSTQDICIDEPYSIFHSQFGVEDIIRFLKPTNNPPLFEIILHYWIKVFGISAFSVRFLPLLFGSLAVIFIFRISEKLFSYQVGIASSLLYTFSTISIYYSHDCRVYTLFLLLTTISVYFFIKLFEGSSSFWDKLFFCACNLLIIYAHYFGFIVWFIEVTYVLIYGRKYFMRFAVLLGISIVFYLPQILIFLERFKQSSSEGTWIKELVTIENLYNRLWSFCNMPVVVVLCLAILVAAGVKKASSKLLKKENSEDGSNTNKKINLIGIWFFVPYVLMFVISFKVPIYLERYLIFIAPAFYILVCSLVNYLFDNKNLRNVAFFVLILSFAITLQLNPDKKRESSKVIDYVKQNKDSETLVIICAHDFINNFAFYYDKKIFQNVIPGIEYETLNKSLNSENVFPVRTINEINSDILKKFRKIIYLDAAADFSNPGNGILQALENNYKLNTKKHFNTIFDVYIFVS